MKLDKIDLKILAELQKDGRQTNVKLAEKVCLSATPCRLRTEKLEKAGYITSYGANLNLSKLSDYVIIYTEFTLDRHFRNNFKTFEGLLQSMPEVVECHLVSGGYDYLVKFVTKSIAKYQQLVDSLIEENRLVREYYSYIVTKTPVEARAVDLDVVFPFNPVQCNREEGKTDEHELC